MRSAVELPQIKDAIMEPQNTLKDAEVIEMVRQIISFFVRH